MLPSNCVTHPTRLPLRNVDVVSVEDSRCDKSISTLLDSAFATEFTRSVGNAPVGDAFAGVGAVSFASDGEASTPGPEFDNWKCRRERRRGPHSLNITMTQSCFSNIFDCCSRCARRANHLLKCVAHFDNSDQNPSNPDPTKQVRWGEQTWDEMMIGNFEAVFMNQNLSIPEPMLTAIGDDRYRVRFTCKPELRLCDVSQERETSEARVIEIADSRITAVGFTPNGKQLVIAAANGTAFVRGIDDDKKRISLSSHPFAIWSLAFDTNGERMVAGSWDGTTRIWDTGSWQMIQKLKGHEESVSAMILGKQGMISAGLDGRLLFWPPQIPGIKPKGMITGPAEPVWVAVYSPDGKRLFLGGRGGRSEMWDVEKHELLFSTQGHPTTRCAAFSPDGKTLATGGDDRMIMLSSAEDGQIRHMLEGHLGLVSAVAFIDGGKTLVSGCDRGLLKFWDTTTGKETASLHRHKQQLYCANVSPDQKWLITGGGHWAKGDPGELIVWDLANRQFKATLPGHTLTVWSIVFTTDGKYFATSDSAGDVKIWNTERLKEARTLKHETWVRPMAMSPDGKTLAVGRGDGPVRLWDTVTWTEKGTCNGHDGFTFWLQYSPDGNTLATSGNDGTVRFWETQSEFVEK